MACAARGAEMDAAMTERILLLGRSHGGEADLTPPRALLA